MKGEGHDFMEMNCTKGGYKCTSHSSQCYCENIPWTSLPAAWGELELLVLKQKHAGKGGERIESMRERKRKLRLDKGLV